MEEYFGEVNMKSANKVKSSKEIKDKKRDDSRIMTSQPAGEEKINDSEAMQRYIKQNEQVCLNKKKEFKNDIANMDISHMRIKDIFNIHIDINRDVQIGESTKFK